MSDTPFLTHSAFKPDGIRYGFFTREGGVSTGVFESLNVSERPNERDTPENVQENLRRIAEAMGVEASQLISCKQTHSKIVMTVDKPWTVRPEADGIVTKTRGLALGIKTADCGPVLFHDDKANVIGACHAGWRGAVGGVLEETVKSMEKLGATASNISAIVGACIQQNSYEVGPEFPAPFLKQDEANNAFFKKAPRENHFLFDLPGYIQHRLKLLGLKQALTLGFDTCTDEKRFFSYRRATLRKDGDNGTLLSVIVLA
jgi:YfiH family protein